MEFKEYPCVDTSSSVEFEKTILQTWEPVYVVFVHFISLISQNLIVLSVEPPPVANILFLWGDQARALTAAVCYVSLPIYLFILGYQTKTMLSFPPEAK